MGRGRDKEYKIDKQGLKQILGRIFRPRHGEDQADPFLIVKDGSMKIRLDAVIHCIENNPDSDDCGIVGHLGPQHCIHGVRPSDIEIVRAYMHRFGSDISQPLPIEAHPVRTLLLDENMPQPAMLHLSKNFGWATHVAAEGFSGRDTPDEEIWKFASDKNFHAIVTRDTDFLEIQERRARAAWDDGLAAPFLIFVDGNVSTESLTGIFSRHKTPIQRYMNEATCLAISVSDKAAPKPLF